MAYWLFKSEPAEYSFQDLMAEPNGTARWDGIRNYQARNLIRDHIKAGDEVFIYHSRCKLIGVAGIAKVVSDSYPDPAQFDVNSPYFDPKSTQQNPKWYCVDVEAVTAFDAVVPLKQIKQQTELQDMVLLKQGRLSVQPVTVNEWQVVVNLASNKK